MFTIWDFFRWTTALCASIRSTRHEGIVAQRGRGRTCEVGAVHLRGRVAQNRGSDVQIWTSNIVLDSSGVDLDGLNMRHLWRPGVRALLRIIEIVAANYPETMALALVVRAPRVAPVLWTLVGPLIDERTRQKFMIYGGNDYCSEGGLINYIARRLIPDFLGGGAFCLAPEGGIVPKSLYLPDDPLAEGFRDRSPSVGQHDVLGTMYMKGLVYRGLPHEVLCPVTMSGSVLTWDIGVDFCLLMTSCLSN